MSDLYELLLSEDSKNECAHSCQLPLSSIKKMVQNGTCNPNLTTQFLCGELQKTSTTKIKTITSKPKITTTPRVRPDGGKNRTFMASTSCASNNKFYAVILVVIGVIPTFRITYF